MGMKSNSMAIAFKPTGLLQIRTQSGPNQSACPPTEVTKQGKCPGRISFGDNDRGEAGYLHVTGGHRDNQTLVRVPSLGNNAVLKFDDCDISAN